MPAPPNSTDNLWLLQLLVSLGLDRHEGARTEHQQHKAKDIVVVLAGLSGAVAIGDLAGIATKPELRSREVVDKLNTAMGWNISSGSYDDIRRKSVAALRSIGVVEQRSLNRNINDGTQGYWLSDDFVALLAGLADKNYPDRPCDDDIRAFAEAHWGPDSLSPDARLADSSGAFHVAGIGDIELENDEHDKVLRQCLEELLPRRYPGFKVAYVQTGGNRYGQRNDGLLGAAGITIERGAAAPDLIAVDEKQQMALLLEVVKTSNPLSRERLHDLSGLFEGGEIPDNTVLVTAFENRRRFRSCADRIVWGSFVWIATEPEHHVHYVRSALQGPLRSQIQGEPSGELEAAGEPPTDVV